MPINFVRPSAAFTGHKWALALERTPILDTEGAEEYQYVILAKAFPVTTAGVITHDDSHADNIFTAYPPTDEYEDPSYQNAPFSGGTSGCSATIVFHSGTFSSAPGGTISLTDSKGDTLTYTATSSTPSGANREFLCSGPAASAVAQNFKTLVNSSSGHGGTIIATRSAGSVLLVQNGMLAASAAYSNGNTPITYSAFSGMLSGTAPTQFSGGVDAVSAGSASGFSVLRLTDGYNTIEQAVSALKIKVVDTPPSSVPTASAAAVGAFNGSANFGTSKYVDISGMRSDWSAVSGTAMAAQQRVYFTVPLDYSLNTAFSACSQVSATALLGRGEVAINQQTSFNSSNPTSEPPPATAEMKMCCCKYTNTSLVNLWVIMERGDDTGTRKVKIRGKMSKAVSKIEHCVEDSTNPKCGDDSCVAKATINTYISQTKGGTANSPCKSRGKKRIANDLDNNKNVEDGEVMATGGIKGENRGTFYGWKGGKSELGTAVAVCIRYHIKKTVWLRTNIDRLITNCTSDCPSSDDSGDVSKEFHNDFSITEPGCGNPGPGGAGSLDHPNGLRGSILSGIADAFSGTAGGAADIDSDLVDGDKDWGWNGDDSGTIDNGQAGNTHGGVGGEADKGFDDIFYPKLARDDSVKANGWFRQTEKGKVVDCVKKSDAGKDEHSKDMGNSADNPIVPPKDMFDDTGSFIEVNTFESGGPNDNWDYGSKGTQGRQNNQVNQNGQELCEWLLANADGFQDSDLGVGGTNGSRRGHNACKEEIKCSVDVSKKTM